MSDAFQTPTRGANAVFYVKSSLLTLRRHVANVIAPVRTFGTGTSPADARIIAASATPLWNGADVESNVVLTAGKVQNLRVAARALNGIDIPANTVFSFWAHIGRPRAGKGYVVGREIREGCLVPTIAGGLCQLSNALYDAALQAGCTILERHRHSQVVSGSLAERDRDATVKWNYLDLWFTSSRPLHLTVELTADALLVQFESAKAHRDTAQPNDRVIVARQSTTLNDCYSCGTHTCIKHAPNTRKSVVHGTTYVLDEYWPEFADYVHECATERDTIIVPSLNGSHLSVPRHAWSIPKSSDVIQLRRGAWYRTARNRVARAANNNVFSSTLQGDHAFAGMVAREIPWEDAHVVVSQNLLPFLWDTGVFGGRTFDVLMTRLPLFALHERLDRAFAMHPSSSTLHDFRASPDLVASEREALANARRVISPHCEITAMFPRQAHVLQWHVPRRERSLPGTKILFPGSALGRKGAYEMRRLARELQLSLVVLGGTTEDPRFWDDVLTEHVNGDPLEGIGTVIYPSYVEHQPRLLLRAIAAGIPVVASAACGLPPADNLVIVPTGDYNALRDAVSSVLRN